MVAVTRRSVALCVIRVSVVSECVLFKFDIVRSRAQKFPA